MRAIDSVQKGKRRIQLALWTSFLDDEKEVLDLEETSLAMRA